MSEDFKADHGLSLMLFLFSFVLVSAVGMGLLAALWAHLSRAGLARYVPVRLVYLGGAWATIALGVLWMGLCYADRLEAVVFFSYILRFMMVMR